MALTRDYMGLTRASLGTPTGTRTQDTRIKSPGKLSVTSPGISLSVSQPLGVMDGVSIHMDTIPPILTTHPMGRGGSLSSARATMVFAGTPIALPIFASFVYGMSRSPPR